MKKPQLLALSLVRTVNGWLPRRWTKQHGYGMWLGPALTLVAFENPRLPAPAGPRPDQFLLQERNRRLYYDELTAKTQLEDGRY